MDRDGKTLHWKNLVGEIQNVGDGWGFFFKCRDFGENQASNGVNFLKPLVVGVGVGDTAQLYGEYFINHKDPY